MSRLIYFSITTYSAFFGIRWCVLQTMQYARCTMEDVIRVTQRSEVRRGLLDNIPDDCGKYMYWQFIKRILGECPLISS